jgi:hypothetical protein
MNQLLAVRNFFGFTQAQMADYLNVHQSIVALHEGGTRPLPAEAGKKLEEITSRMAAFENPADPNSLFESTEGAEDWKNRAVTARNAAALLRKQIDQLLQSQKQTLRVIGFTESVAEIENSPLAEGSFWWRVQRDQCQKKIPKFSKNEIRKLELKIALLEEEARMAEKFSK